MCGICGALRLDAATPQPGLKLVVQAMLAAMVHRGPGGNLLEARPDLVMAANRLPIRSVDHGRPPLVGCEPGVLVACNGEIDNHRELTARLRACGQPVPDGSDVSVIGPLYLQRDLGFLDALRGVFALALWDARRRRLVLARDRVGERHLHYVVADGVLYFASELAALMACGVAHNAVDVAAVSRYVGAGYCPTRQDPITGCCKLRPGEALVVDPAGIRHEHFWEVPLGKAPKSVPSQDAFDSVFRGAIRRQTDVDVDYGVLLSGGVDSALVTAVTREVRREHPLTAYCVRFAEATFDESRHAADVARSLGCAFVPVDVAADDFPAVLRHLIAATGELLGDPAWVAEAMVSQRASRDVPMLLGGEGADELFGGYPTYPGAGLAEQYGRLPKIVRRAIRGVIKRLPADDKNMTVAFMLKRFVAGEGLAGVARHRLWNAATPPGLLAALGMDLPATASAEDGVPKVLDAVQRDDFTRSLPEKLLAKADRGGMCHAVEIRAPFLDQAVVEFAASLPATSRVRGLTTKVFLKRYATRYLPLSTVNRRKRGLSVPLARWLRGPLQAWARARLAADALQDAGIDNLAALRLLAEHCAQENDHARAIWALVVLSEWLEWRRHLGDPEPAAHAPQTADPGYVMR